jgi:hypothetical protein
VARRWAHDELERLKGKPTIAEEEKAQRRIGEERANALTFARAAELLLKASSERGMTDAYRDRLLKLFFKHVLPQVAEKRVCEVTLDDISMILNAEGLRLGNLRIFRPFIAQLLDIPSRFGVKAAATPYCLKKISMSPETGSTTIAPLCGWTKVDYERFFERFETGQDKWQQARCLRLYFRLSCPLSRLLKARWDQLWVVFVREGTINTGNSDRRIQWRYDESWRGAHMLGRASERIIRECHELCRSKYPGSEFWFPSSFGRQVGHIRSIDHFWRSALAAQELRYFSPRAFRAAYREAWPWHEVWTETIVTWPLGRSDANVSGD